MMLRTTLIKYWSNNLRCYGHTWIQSTNAGSSSKGSKTLQRPVLIEDESADKKRFDSDFIHIVSWVNRHKNYWLKPAMNHLITTMNKNHTQCWSSHIRYYRATTIQMTQKNSSSKGREFEHRGVLTSEDKERFDSLLPEMVSCLIGYNDYRLRPAMERIKLVMDYSTLYGYQITGLQTVASYKTLTAEQSEEQLKKACVLDWCIEMIMASSFIKDDICDNSLTRQRKPCWHRLDNVGLSFAINDLLMLERGTYWLLKTYFGNEPYYNNLVELYHEVLLKDVSGQTMDIWLSRQHLNFEQFNQDNYEVLSSNKGLMPSLYLPLAWAMHMVGNPAKEDLRVIEEICLSICGLWQAKDDYSDCFGHPNGSSVMGNDIEEGKCTWLIVNALKLANEEEINLLRMWYGKRDPELVKLVRAKYVELQLDRMFSEYEKKTHEAIATTVEQLPCTFPAKILEYYLNDILKIHFED